MKILPLLASVALALVLGSAASGFDLAGDQSILRDPEWRKSFLGSYGFLSGAEPQVNDLEIELLQEVIELMKADTAAAAARLQAQVGPNSSAALDFILANLEFQNGQLEPAASHYESALGKFPDFRRAHKNLGLLRVQQGRIEEALGHLSRAVELGDRDGRNYGLIGFCYIDQGKPLAAEIAYRNAIMQQPDVRDWKLGLARALLALEHYKDAAALFDELLEASPEDSTIWMLQANAYVGLEQPMAAAVNLEAVRALGEAPSSSLILLGDIYMNAGMPELARSAYVEVVERDEDTTRFETALRAARLLVRTRAFADAEALVGSIQKRYGSALTTDQELEFLTLQAKLARAQGREKEAVALLGSIVERDGTRGEALLELASHHQSQGDIERALLLVERAEKLEAFEYPALIEHAQIKVAEKDYAAAAALLRRALTIKREPRVEAFLAQLEDAGRR